MKQKRRTKRLLALALLLASVLGLAGASQIASVSVAAPKPGVVLLSTPVHTPHTIPQETGEEWTRHFDEALGFSWACPSSWHAFALEDMPPRVIVFRKEEPPRAILFLTAQYDKAAIEAWRLQDRNAFVAGLPAMRKSFPGGQNPPMEMVSFLHQGRLVILSLVYGEGFDLDDFDRVINSAAIATGSELPTHFQTVGSLALLWNPCIPDCGIKAGDPTWCDLLVSAGEWGGVDVYSNGTSMDNACSDYYGLKFQCVELVQRFYWEKRGHDTGTGNPRWGINYAYQAWNTHPASLVQRPNGGGFTPEWGDILVWRNEGPYTYGHVAIVTGASADTVYFVQQNIPGKHRSSRPISNGRIQDDYLYGWLHYTGGPTPPDRPTNLSASATGQTSINLSWTDNSNNEDGFKISRNGSQIATVGANTTSYDDNSLSCGTTYSYYVKAYNSAGDSDPSNTDSATTDDCSPPPAPSLNSPCNGQQFVSCANITLDWDESSGATQYQAKYWDGSSDTSDWMSGTSWNVGTLSPGNYSWQARAKNEWGESPWSDTCSFMVNPNQSPNTPSPQSPGDGAWVNSRSPTLQWSVPSDDGCPRGLTYNAQIERITGGSWSTNISDHSGTSWSPSLPSDDDYRWRVQAYDGDLTSGWSDYRTVRVDATPPDTSITNGPSGVIPTGSATFTWTGSDNRTSTGDLVYSHRLVGLSNDWSSWSTATSVTYNGLTDGDYTFEVKAKDKASNEDASPATRSFGVDVTPPETTITSGPSGCISTADVTFTWTGSDNRTSTAELLYSYKLEGFDDWSAWTGATTKSYTSLPDGDYTFKVKARDGVGHEDPSPAARSLRVDTTPPTGSVLVNGGDSTTNKIAVHLDITGDDGPVGCGVTEMRLSNDGFNWEAWEPFATEGEWLLPTLNRTTWTVHLQLKDLVGNMSEAFTDDIYLDLYPPRPASENYQLGARVVASGDPTSTSESYGLLSATMGQPIADGRMQGADYRLESGYQGAWPSVPRGRPTPESYDTKASLIASSGKYQTSESYRLQSATGQPTDVGPRSSENYQLLSGYLPCKLFGDIDVNGRVDVADIMMVASRWRCQSGDDCYHEHYDLDKDGIITVVDIMKVAAHWGETCE